MAETVRSVDIVLGAPKAREDLMGMTVTLPDVSDRVTIRAEARAQIGLREATKALPVLGPIGAIERTYEPPAVYAPLIPRRIHTGKKMETT